MLCDSKMERADCLVHGSMCVWKIDPTVIPGGGTCLVGAVTAQGIGHPEIITAESVKEAGVDHHDPGSEAVLCDSKMERADCLVHGTMCVWKIDPTVIPGGGTCLVGAVTAQGIGHPEIITAESV